MGGRGSYAVVVSFSEVSFEEVWINPGKLTLALGITRKQNGADLTESALQVRGLRDEPAVEIATTPRIGITHCAD
jgi:3-methyladenine DNA glycosylase Mpg